LEGQVLSEGDLTERLLGRMHRMVGAIEKITANIASLGGSTFGIQLKTAASEGYRTWSCKEVTSRIHLGNWKVNVVDSDGKTYASRDFRIIKKMIH